MNRTPSPFTVAVTDAEIDDLRRRLHATRWPGPATVEDWTQGVPEAYVQELCRYWADEYDWPARQGLLNAVPQYVLDVQGLPIHFLHVPSPVEGALPLLLTHGWPGSVAEFLDVIGPLTDPAAHGGDPVDAFSVVVPSLPGYGWSGKPTTPGWGLERTADAWAELMSGLGYEQFGAQGGDLGSFVSANLAHRHPDRVVGIHLNMVLTPPPSDRTEFSAREQLGLQKIKYFNGYDGAYNLLHRTRPQTLAYGLTDSPAGQCAWILEKFWAWSDCGGDPVAALGADRILDHVATYWFSRSAASGAQMYWEVRQAAATVMPTVDGPTGVSLFPHDILLPTEEWAKAQYTDLRMWREHDRGGHFAAMEQPDLLVGDIRDFFRPLRRTGGNVV